MKHIGIAKAILSAGMRLDAEFKGGAKMRVHHFDDAEGRVVGQFIEGPLELVHEDELRNSPANLIVAYRIVL